MRILGVDPGLTGALCLRVTDTGETIITDIPTLQVKTSKNKVRVEYDIPNIAKNIKELNPRIAFIEQVSARPGQGVTSMFRFGQGYGILLGVIATLGISVNLVPPNQWTRIMKVPQGKDGSRLRAGQLLPEQSNLFQRVKDHGRADAALIALFGERSLDNPF